MIQVGGQRVEEVKPVEVDRVEEWEIEKILNKIKIRGVVSILYIGRGLQQKIIYGKEKKTQKIQRRQWQNSKGG